VICEKQAKIGFIFVQAFLDGGANHVVDLIEEVASK